MAEQLCIRCREPIGTRRRYTWSSREQEFIDIAQIVIDELVDNGVSSFLSLFILIPFIEYDIISVVLT